MDRRESGTGEAAADKTSCDDIRTGLEGEISGQNDVIGESTLLGGKNGGDYGTISIRQQATRWGSCSSRGNLNFNWTLILTPEPLQDYVVVHELAHLSGDEPSDRFWKIVESQIPDYKERRNLLKTYENQVTVME